MKHAIPSTLIVLTLLLFGCTAENPTQKDENTMNDEGPVVEEIELKEATTEMLENSASATVITYIEEDTFTEEDKGMLQTHVIERFLSYNESIGSPIKTIEIKKVGTVLPVFHIYYDDGDGFALSPIKGETTSLDEYPIWSPDCMYLDCRDIPESYKEKYPDSFES